MTNNERFPVLQQYDAMDCGPTCLAMISKSYGKNYNIEHLHDLCNISNEGVSLYGISIAAEKIGFHTVGTQLSLIQLIDEMPLPCILHWNQNHFVVLYKIKKTKKGCAFCCVIFRDVYSLSTYRANHPHHVC